MSEGSPDNILISKVVSSSSAIGEITPPCTFILPNVIIMCSVLQCSSSHLNIDLLSN